MKVILSPAKSLKEQANFDGRKVTKPIFQDESEKLAKKLEKLSKKKIKDLMSISDKLAELNYNRYQNWSPPYEADDSIPAAYMFDGAAYKTLDFESLTDKEVDIAQNKLRILSGLYGLLKPLDLIQPYRLEMGTKLAITSKVKNLYDFWGNKIKDTLEQELKEDKEAVLVNAASNEYSKAAKLNKLDATVITTVFKDRAKDGNYKVNFQWAKMARGNMARFIIQHNLEKAEDLKGFDTDGYYFSPNDSSDKEFVYLRDKQ